MTNGTGKIEFIPTTGGAGLEVGGVNLAEEPSEELVQLFKQKMAEHGLLIFHDQDLSEEQQLRFTRSFGETIGHPLPGVGGTNPEENASPEVFYLTNAIDDSYEKEKKEKKRGSSDGSLGWHSDLQYMPEPQVYSVLFGVEVPPEGGETEYCNMKAAYDALDDTTKEKIANLEATHWFTRKIPAVTHPVVRAHPLDGSKSLYVSPGLTRLIEGMEKEDGATLLQELCEHATQPRFCWAHRWKQNDVLMWDNRCTMHRRLPFDITQRRIVRRTQTAGEPVLA